MQDFLMFRSFVSHNLVKIFFYLVLALMALTFVGAVGVTFFTEGVVQSALVAVGAAFVFAIYAIFLRVMCEMMIVVFQIHDELKRFNDRA